MRRRSQPARAETVPSATSLPQGRRQDHDTRVRNYLVSMGIRTLCFIGAFVFTGWLRWTCVVLAVVLPYIAVVFANATQQRRIDQLGSVDPGARGRLGPGSSRAAP